MKATSRGRPSQPASQARDFNPDYRIGSGIKRRATSDPFGTEGVLLQQFRLARESPFEKEPQEAARPSRPLKCTAGENPFQLAKHIFTRDRHVRIRLGRLL